VNARELLDALEKQHAAQYGWVFIRELRLGTGYSHLSDQRVDAWAINCWKLQRFGAPYMRRAFEIKVSAADVRKELLDPDKRWVAYAISNEFWFCTPPGLIDPRLLAKDDGLQEFDGNNWKIIKPPRQREGMPPRWSFVAGLARRLTRGVEGID
jgi:hypothetical protein